MSERVCPNCGMDVLPQTKDEAGYCKYWFVCPEPDGCGWESRTFRGPNVDPNESRVEEEGYDRVMEHARREALEEASEKTVEDFST